MPPFTKSVWRTQSMRRLSEWHIRQVDRREVDTAMARLEAAATNLIRYLKARLPYLGHLHPRH